MHVFTMKSGLYRIVLVISKPKKLGLIACDIGNSYLNSNANKVIYSCTSPELKLVSNVSDRILLKVVNALYGFPSRVNDDNYHLSYNLRYMGYNTTRFDPNVCIKGYNVGYNHYVTQTDDILVVSKYLPHIF